MNVIKDLEKCIGKSVNDIPQTFFKYLVEYRYKNCGRRYPAANYNLGEIDYSNPQSFEKLFLKRHLIILWHFNGTVTDLEIYDIFNDLEVLVNDYEHIIKMINDDKVCDLRQGQTKYLGAKRLNEKTLINGTDEVNKREFVLKKSYLQKILNEIS